MARVTEFDKLESIMKIIVLLQHYDQLDKFESIKYDTPGDNTPSNVAMFTKVYQKAMQLPKSKQESFLADCKQVIDFQGNLELNNSVTFIGPYRIAKQEYWAGYIVYHVWVEQSGINFYMVKLGKVVFYNVLWKNEINAIIHRHLTGELPDQTSTSDWSKLCNEVLSADAATTANAIIKYCSQEQVLLITEYIKQYPK